MKAKFSKKRLTSEITQEGRVLGLHPGSTQIIAEKVSDKVAKWASGRSEITEEDLIRVVSRELSRYNKDLSYVYKHQNKII